MDAQLTSVANDCLNAAYDKTMNFPEIVGTLIRAGFEGYVVDYRRHTTAYYFPDGDSIVLENRPSEGKVVAQFDQVGVAAQVKWAQCQGLLEQEGGGLLVHSKTSLIENALDVGYGNAFQFTRTFKRTFSQTPTQLRPSALEIQ
ncbi:hypothetical protein RGCCGE502_17690 [Rhizobium grahamii CCGE 502]|uniref:HTH araC/xylS-type domain-containing protein n=1 Tax=Rhizobium grahamii CCGE 502 TaxID=990285 RepID=S3HUT5_9HYPH|nr:hypothetical protein RGCCGE502_17690 [Rhizobium grahamii CCGE 502]